MIYVNHIAINLQTLCKLYSDKLMEFMSTKFNGADYENSLCGIGQRRAKASA